MSNDVMESPVKAKGRPRKHQDYTAAKTIIDKYFKDITGESGEYCKPPTLNGLTLELGYYEKAQLYENAENNVVISKLLKKAITRIEAYYEHCLTTRPQCTGAIFWLKNRGWKDIQEVKVNDEQAKAITESQREVARQLVERHILTTSLPQAAQSITEGIKAYPEPLSTIVGHPTQSDIGRSTMDTSFTSDNKDTTTDNKP